MDASDVIQLLRFYRHDLLNQLQLIGGYLSMDKPASAKEKLDNYARYLDKEKKLLNLNAPSFALWLLFFNDTYQNFRMTYDIQADNSHLEKEDALLTSQCEEIFHYLGEHLPQSEFYEGFFLLEVEDIPDTSIKVSIKQSGDFRKVDVEAIKQLNGILQLQINKTETGMQCTFLLPLQDEVD